jgi:hypothetical protein
MKWLFLHTQHAPPSSQRLLSRTRQAISVIAIGTVAAVLGLGARGAQCEPTGLVKEPRLTGFDISDPETKLFNFKGYTNFPGSEGRVEIYILRQGNGDSSNAVLWPEQPDLTAYPLEKGTVVGSETRYPWSTGDIALFKNSPGENRWPLGGTARLRFKAVQGSDSAFLPVRDSDKKLGQDLELVLSDHNPNPAQPTTGQLTPNYLSKKSIKFPAQDGTTQEDETYRYYHFALVDRAKTQNILEALPNVEKFRERYFGPIVENPERPDCVRLSTPEVVAKYFNKGDLGLGREMHCIDNQCTREVACYVKNYGVVF